MGRSGLIVKEVELWRKTVSQNNYGENIQDWSLLSRPRGYVLRKSSKYTTVNDEEMDVDTIRVEIRNQWGVREQDRIKYLGNLYDVYRLQPKDITERWLIVYCKRLNE